MDKKALRDQIRRQKRAMTPEQIEAKSRVLCESFLETEEYRNTRTLFAYLPYNQEVRTWAIVEQAFRDGKKVCLPKIYGPDMLFIMVDSLDQVAKGYCGIPEPIADGPLADDPTGLVLMPGMVFDPKGHRIGYGGGFYDKFLEREPNHPKVALCYDFQVVDHLETEEFDIPVDKVIWA